MNYGYGGRESAHSAERNIRVVPYWAPLTETLVIVTDGATVGAAVVQYGIDCGRTLPSCTYYLNGVECTPLTLLDRCESNSIIILILSFHIQFLGRLASPLPVFGQHAAGDHWPRQWTSG
jgi:hypothetical protein